MIIATSKTQQARTIIPIVADHRLRAQSGLPGRRVFLGLVQSLLPYLKVAPRVRWLVIADANGSAYLEAYRHLPSQLAMTDYFKKILLVNGAGQVKEIAKQEPCL